MDNTILIIESIIDKSMDILKFDQKGKIYGYDNYGVDKIIIWATKLYGIKGTLTCVEFFSKLDNIECKYKDFMHTNSKLNYFGGIIDDLVTIP